MYSYMYSYLYSYVFGGEVSICHSINLHFFMEIVFFAKAARQLLQVEHYDAVVEERSLEGLCGHPPCSEAVLEVPERNLLNFWLREIYRLSNVT